MFGKPSQEEMQARYRALAEQSVLRNGELPTAPAGTQQVIYGQNQNSLGLNYGDAAPTIYERNGRKFFYNPHGGNDYVYNERTGAYHAGGGSGGILMLSPAKKVEEEEEEEENNNQASSNNSGGGGGGGGDDNGGGKKPPETAKVSYQRPNKKVLGHKVSTKTILGDTYDDMVNYNPVTTGQPENTLVNPSNWLVKLDPNDALAKDPGQLKWNKPIVLNPYSIS